MEQIKQLLDLLAETPQMALWGLGIWCLYILAKLASVVYAIKVIFQLAINKWHDYKIKKLELKSVLANVENEKIKLEQEQTRFRHDKEFADIKKLAKRFDKLKISNVEMDELCKLLDAVKSTNYIHQSDIDKAVKTLAIAKQSA